MVGYRSRRLAMFLSDVGVFLGKVFYSRSDKLRNFQYWPKYVLGFI